MSALQTEFEFTLPDGYVDDEGTLHRDGVMRLATGADEIQPLQDPRVQSNGSYLTIILLSRVVTELGSVPEVTPHVIENLFVADLSYLQDLYERVNTRGADAVDAVCPDCGERFEAHVRPGSNTATVVADGTTDADAPADGDDTESATDHAGPNPVAEIDRGRPTSDGSGASASTPGTGVGSGNSGE